MFILPYQHGLNVIESYFNQLKHYIKLEEPMNYNEIKQAIRRSIRKIKKSNYMNYFKGTYRKSNIIKNIKRTSRYFKKAKIYKD